jgi:hypothetical protein
MTLPAFGAPVDPAYQRFADGLHLHLPMPDELLRWRWHPRDEWWLSYPQAISILEDVGLPPLTIDSSYLKSSYDFNVGVTTYQLNIAADAIFLPQLFQSIRTYFTERAKGPYPDAVWEPRQGLWRVATHRAGDKPPGSQPGQLPEGARSRIAIIDEAEREGKLTRGDADRLRAQVIATYTR